MELHFFFIRQSVSCFVVIRLVSLKINIKSQFLDNEHKNKDVSLELVITAHGLVFILCFH